MKLKLLAATTLTALALAACNTVQDNVPPPETLALTACTQTWPLLQTGASGTPVTALQHLLNHHSAGIGVDGQFGPQTQGAVEAFQRTRSLGVDGKVGPQTWGALTSNLVLREGSRGEAVKAVQAAVGVTQDGAFGPQTRSAVVSFQSSKGISADGIVGPHTWTVLVGGSVTCSGTPPAPGDAASLARTLIAQDDSGELDIKADPRGDLEETAAGQPVTAGNGSVVNLSTKMLQEVVNLSSAFGTLRISSFAGCCHSSTSYHYAGRAVDISAIDGVFVINRGRDAQVQRLIDLCDASGAVESIGPGEPGHDDHVHCAW